MAGIFFFQVPAMKCFTHFSRSACDLRQDKKKTLLKSVNLSASLSDRHMKEGHVFICHPLRPKFAIPGVELIYFASTGRTTEKLFKACGSVYRNKCKTYKKGMKRDLDFSCCFQRKVTTVCSCGLVLFLPQGFTAGRPWSVPDLKLPR